MPLNTNMNTQDPNAAQGPPEQAGDTMIGGEIGGGEQASPEEQDAYERTVLAGMKMIYSAQSKDALVKQLSVGAGEPAKTLANSTAILIGQLDQQTGGRIPETVILPAAGEILEQVIDLSDSLKLFPIDDAVGNRAAQILVNTLNETYGVDVEEISEVVKSIDPSILKDIEVTQSAYELKQPPKEGA